MEAFAKDQFGARERERGVMLRTFTALNAVVGPQGLRAVTEVDLFEGLLAWVGRSKRVVIGVCQSWVRMMCSKERGDAMDCRDYGIAIGNGKRAAGAEIILHVDDEEDILRSDLYRGHVLVPILCSLWPVERTGGTCADRHAGQ